MPRFRDRASAGSVLAGSLARFAGESGLVVLGVARGGVPVARRVATMLGATLRVVVARRLPVPGVEDLALGAIVEGSRRITINPAAQHFSTPPHLLERIATRERVELERCASLYHAASPPLDLRGRVVVIVDDGLVTGGTLRAVARVARRAGPARLIAAVPVASPWGLQLVAREVDDVVVAFVPPQLETVAEAYDDAVPVTDDDVLEALGRRRQRVSPLTRSERRRLAMTSLDDRFRDREQTIAVPVAGGVIRAHSGVPRGFHERIVRPPDPARGLVIIAHMHASELPGIAGRYLAGRLRLAGYASLRLSLTTIWEQRLVGELRSVIDAPTLARRVTDVCDWVAHEGIAGGERTILVGAGAVGTAALVTAARRYRQVRGVVVCGGHADFVARSLSQVDTAVLLLANANDRAAARHGSASVRELPGRAEIVRAPHADYALEEPTAAGFLAERTVEWLDRLDRWERAKASRRLH